jgi:hypothetical protein
LRICWMPSPSSARLRLTSAMSISAMWTKKNVGNYVCDRGAGGCRRVPMRVGRGCDGDAMVNALDRRWLLQGSGRRVKGVRVGAVRHWKSCEAARLHCPGQVRRRLLLPPHGACEVLAKRGASQPPALIPADDERAPSRHSASRHRPPQVNRARELDTDKFTPTKSHHGPQSPLLERPR